ncbi:unnamed protein product, partial [Medioppia subpectinata]
MSKVDSISYLYYKGIAFILTSNGYYYVISEEDVKRDDVKEFQPSGKVPHLANCCDSAVIKDINDCDDDLHNEHSIAFTKPFNNDIILSNINIDYSQPIDAVFSTDNVGEIFFIQGQYYSGIEFQESCPKSREQLIVYNKRKLTELNVETNIDSAYYEHNGVDNPILYLTNYDKMQFYRIEIDSFNSKDGKLVPIKTTIEQLSSHPIFSRI